jgi:hypothetical protein
MWAVWYTLAFIVILVIYLIILSIFDSYAKEYQKELEEKGFDSRFLEGKTKAYKKREKIIIPILRQVKSIARRITNSPKNPFFEPTK